MNKTLILCAALAAASFGASAQDWRAQRDSQAQAQQQYQAPQPGSEHYNPELDPRSPTYKPQGDPGNPQAYDRRQYDERGYYRDNRDNRDWRDQRAWENREHRRNWAYSHNPRWSQGNYAPEYRQQRYWVRDWQQRRLAPPPRGYQWVETDTGELLLIALTTGLIASVILQQ